MPSLIEKTLENPTCTTTPLSRRNWCKRIAGTVVGGVLGVGCYTRFVEPHWVEVVRRNMPIAGLPKSLEGRTLVQISDVHIGDFVDEQYLITSFQRVAEWKPDIVTFTGDFLTLRRDRTLPIDSMERVLGHFPQGQLATVGILGNHDYGLGWHNIQSANSVVDLAKNAGIEIVRNGARDVAGLQIVGFDDYWGPNFAGDRLMKNVDLSLPTLVLCHNPDVADLPIWSGYRGWILSGHTHGGQCKAPFLTPPMLPVRNKRYSSGAFTLDDGRHLYVNRALGYSWKVRFNVRPEITVFTLKCEDPVES